jgi:hypothetical protein
MKQARPTIDDYREAMRLRHAVGILKAIEIARESDAEMVEKILVTKAKERGYAIDHDAKK